VQVELISSITQFVPTRKNPNPDRVPEAAQAAEADGFDSVLVGYTSGRADGWAVTSRALCATSRLRILLAHRPGMIAPTLAARMAATVATFYDRRLSLNIVTGGSAIDQRREGDYADHDTRYERSMEYIDVLRQCWGATEPFAFEGRFYRAESVFHDLPISDPADIPLYMGGSSAPALEMAATRADVFMSWSEPVDDVAARVRDVLGRAAPHGRRPRVSVSMRLIIGSTEDEAWSVANSIVDPAAAQERLAGRRDHSEDIGRNRQLNFARSGLVLDDRLWMGIVAATGGQGSSGALVGTADQVRESLLKYVRAGADALLLTGPDGAYKKFPDGFLADLRREADKIVAARWALPSSAGAPSGAGGADSDQKALS